jgi:ADP-ribosylglycohydrolase
MLGAIAGDVIGSVYEHNRIKTKAFPLFSPGCDFTDDSVLTVAVAKVILENGTYKESILELGRRYPHAGYGGAFKKWLRSADPQPYNSWGNGSAMRVSPVGWAFDNAEDVLREAERSAVVTHNHPEGIKGAQAAALVVWMARSKADKEHIRSEIAGRFGYNLARTVDEIRPGYTFAVSCQGTVPEAIVAFLDSTSFEDAIRNAISLGGDSDTLACITGSIAEAYYGPVPAPITQKVLELLPPDLRVVVEEFYLRYDVPRTVE